MAPPINEHDTQRAYIIWARGVQRPDGSWNVRPALRPGVICWSTPNGGNRDGREAMRLKQEGVLPGFPDVAHLWGGLFLTEFKHPNGGGRLSPAQLSLHPRLIAAGAKVAIVDSLDAAKAQARAWQLVLDNC